MVMITMVLAFLAATTAQTDISASGPSGPLKGTLSSASVSSAPVVLIIPGSGPTDRDGNNPLGVKTVEAAGDTQP